MKLKYKLIISVSILGFFTLLVGIFSYYQINMSSITRVELENDRDNVIYISETIENDLFELIRLTTTLASTDIVKDSLNQSNEEFSSYSEIDRFDYIDELNTTWMNTDDTNDPFIKTRMENDVALFLDSQQENNPGLYGEAFLTNEYGVMISTTGKLTTLAHYEKYWWQGSFNDGEGIVYLDDRGFDASVDGYVLGIVVPVYNEQNEIIGILKSNFNISYIFENSVSNFHRLSCKGEYFVVRTLGLIVSGEDIEPLSEEINENILPYIEDRVDVSEEIDINGVSKFVSVAPIDLTYSSLLIEFGGSYESIDHTGGNSGEGWSIVHMVDKRVVMSELWNTLAVLSLISLGTLALISLAALFIGESLSKPFRELNNYISEVGKGKLIKRETKILNDEIGGLTTSFNKLIDNLSLTLTSKEKLEKEITKKEELEKTLIDKDKEITLILNSTAEGIYGVDLNENCVFVNQTFLNLLGYDSADEVIGKNIHDLIHHSKADGTKNPVSSCAMRATLKDGHSVQHEDNILWRKNGIGIPVVFTSIPKYKEGKLDGAVISFRDITESKKSEYMLRHEKSVAQMYLDIAGVMFVVLNPKGEVTLLNKKGCEILGITIEEAIGIKWFDHFVPKSIVDKMKGVFQAVFESKTNLISQYENVILTAKGEEKLISWNNSLLYDSNNNIIGILSSGVDITEANEFKNKLIKHGYEDRLTGLKNRRYYEEYLSELDIHSNFPLSIIMADINGLKLINDAFGHASGDELLIATANLISEVCREGDLIARVGGDEFVIVLPKTDEKATEEIIEKIQAGTKKTTIKSIPLSISFGYKTKHNIQDDIFDIYRDAEDAMYREKLIEIPSMRSGAIETILTTLHEKDRNSEIHSRRVSDISEKLAKAYGLNRHKISEVKTAALLHDIGKIIVPLEILNKKGKLSNNEYNSMKTHCEIGFRILNSTSNMRDVARIVLNHHERWDGAGYPRGISKEEIPLEARIISIADSVDAMTSKRTYREMISYEEALQEVINNSGTQFDPKLVEVFKDNFVEIIKET